MINILGILRYGLVLIFGVYVSLMFTGVKGTRSSKLAVSCFCVLALFVQILSWYMIGMQYTMKIYPFIIHLPLIVFISIFFKKSWLVSTSSVLAAYLCCQIPRWIGVVMFAIYASKLIDHISYIITMCFIFYFLKKYVANSVRQLIERSTRSCLLFGVVPLLYYLFDYITTIYTDLLYTGAHEVVQFSPSLICAFYFIFVILYYNETQKQIESQRELDIFASQLHQAKLELDKMWQMQNSTMIYRHDMRHHLSLIGGFVADGDIQKIKEYLASTEANIDLLTPNRYCDNEIVNLILSNFNTQAQKESVDLKIDVKLPFELEINDTELCSLLSNVLENAIAAAAQIDDKKLRRVYVHAVINNQKLVISTENAYVGKIEMDGELPKSRKKGDRHGFGIKSIMNIVERYNGLYSFETEGGVFILQILLPLKSLAKI
jgi:hypothetical protein